MLVVAFVRNIWTASERRPYLEMTACGGASHTLSEHEAPVLLFTESSLFDLPSYGYFARARMKKALLTTLQVAVTVFALYWVFRKPETRQGVAVALQGGNDYGWLVAAVLMAGIAPVCATARLWLLLRVQDIHLTIRRVSQLYMIGMFFNLFLLGSTGGDAVKLFYLLRETPDVRKRAGAFLAVVMDRLLGLVALSILSIAFVLARYSWLTQTHDATRLVNGFLGLLGFGLFGIFVTVVSAHYNLVRFLPAKLPGRKVMLELAAAIQSNTRAWRTTLACILISFAGHMAMFIVFYFAALVLRVAVAFWDVTVVTPIINTYASLPISLSGVGLREELFTSLLGDLCHLAQAQAVLISLVGFLCSTVFWGLLGGLFYLFFKGTAGAVPADVEAIEAREEEAVLPTIMAEANHPRPAADA